MTGEVRAATAGEARAVGDSQAGSTAEPRLAGTVRRPVYERIRSLIVNLELRPGAPISENYLAQLIGVSRTPVREAVGLLVEEELVEVFPKVGTFVARVDPVRVAEAQFLRESVEVASLGTIALPLDRSRLHVLRENLDEQDLPRGSAADFFALDEAFHRGLMGLARHEVSWHVVAAAKGHLDRARMIGLTSFPSRADLAAQHRAILDHVVAGDLSQGQELLRAHLRAVFADIEAIETDAPDMFATGSSERPRRIGR